jgi:hypothetical protein
MNRNIRLAAFALSGLGLASPALAAAPQGLAGTLSLQYGQFDASGPTLDVWGVQGQGAFGLAPEFGAEIDGGYTGVSGSGASVDIWNIGGHAFWAPAMGRAGGTVQYQSTSVAGIDLHSTQYGAFGEYFASDQITLGINGGGVSSNASAGCAGCSANADGGYVGGGATAYILPDLGATASVSYVGGAGVNLTTLGIQLEWLFSESLPITGMVGYNYTDISGGGGNFNHWFIGLKFYTDGNGTTLVEKHRNGALDSLVRPGINLNF